MIFAEEGEEVFKPLRRKAIAIIVSSAIAAVPYSLTYWVVLQDLLPPTESYIFSALNYLAFFTTMNPLLIHVSYTLIHLSLAMLERSNAKFNENLDNVKRNEFARLLNSGKELLMLYNMTTSALGPMMAVEALSSMIWQVG